MIIENALDHPIQPVDIRTDMVLTKAFKYHTMAYTARVIVLLCRLDERWGPFTYRRLTDRFPEEARNQHWDFAKLVEQGFIVRHKADVFKVTTQFVDNLKKANDNSLLSS